MYVEMVDETGQVSPEMMKQTLDLLHFAAERLGKETKEMAVTFVTNERSHQLNLEYRDTDRPTDVISLEYKPEVPFTFEEEDLADNPELAEMLEKRSGEPLIPATLTKRLIRCRDELVVCGITFETHRTRDRRELRLRILEPSASPAQRVALGEEEQRNE